MGRPNLRQVHTCEYFINDLEVATHETFNDFHPHRRLRGCCHRLRDR